MNLATGTLILQIITIVGSIIFWFAILRKDLELIKKDVGKIEGIEKYIIDLSNYFSDGEFKGIPDRLKSYKTSCSVYYMANSPLRLTDVGNSFIEDSGFKKIYKKENDFILEHIKLKLREKIDNEAFFYFAERYSVELIKELYYDNSNELLDKVRQYIFTKGLSDTQDVLVKVMGLYVRDKLIEDYGKKEDFNQLFKK